MVFLVTSVNYRPTVTENFLWKRILDITVTNNHTNFSFSIFIKPSQTDLIIPNHKILPTKYKWLLLIQVYRIHKIN